MDEMGDATPRTDKKDMPTCLLVMGMAYVCAKTDRHLKYEPTGTATICDQSRSSGCGTAISCKYSSFFIYA